MAQEQKIKVDAKPAQKTAAGAKTLDKKQETKTNAQNHDNTNTPPVHGTEKKETQSAKIENKKTQGAKQENKSVSKTETKKEAVAKKKFIQYVKKENKAKSKEAREQQKRIFGKKHTPVFRGRFGKKNIRRKSIAKWDKWRKPHGIDLDKGLQHGFRPKIGYGRPADIRGVHPSGYRELLVCNINDLEKIDPKINAARFCATIGKRKRNELMKKANEKGIWVLN